MSAFERTLKHHPVSYRIVQWRRQDFVTGAEVRYGSIGGLEYEVPQSRLYCLCINATLCSTAVQCICRVIRRSSMTMKAHTYYVIFGRPPIWGKLPPSPPGGTTGIVTTRRRRPADTDESHSRRCAHAQLQSLRCSYAPARPPGVVRSISAGCATPLDDVISLLRVDIAVVATPLTAASSRSHQTQL